MGDQTGEVEDLERILSDTSAEPIKISFAAIKYVTKNFAVVIGDGGFGVVYLGGLQNGMIAVKKLVATKDLSDKQFIDEVTCLRKVKHTNVVRLLGYCADTHGEVIEYNGKHRIVEVQQRLLCFEYVPNGNLHNYLEEKTQGYEWSVRYQIIKGICHGLHYIHQEHIYHLDLKPANVLLGVNMEPKITDFGLSRYIGEKSTIVTQKLIGTQGYMAPEFIEKYQISIKSDIYSLGVIMINLLTGCRGGVKENWHTAIDVECPQMKRCIEIAQICVNADPQYRPTAGEIIQSLNEAETVDHACQTCKQKNSEPRNDPTSTLNEVVQNFWALPAKNLPEHAIRVVDSLLMGLDDLKCVIEGRKKPGRLSRRLLEFITGNFSDERVIGQNDHATTYRGILQNQSVAVKMLKSNSITYQIVDQMFQNQIKMKMLAQHKNIVNFLGYCCLIEQEAAEYNGKFIMADITERLLCFEYLSNGTLDQYISDASTGLGWKERYQIFKGMCEGLHFLHNNRIVHLYLKPANILLDDTMVPKIADFSLSRWFNLGESRNITRDINGTPGYMPPEFLFDGVITFKSDIYSLGIITKLILTGKKDYLEIDNASLEIDNLLESWRTRLGTSSTDKLLEQVRVCAEISIACRDRDPEKRPDTERILEMLSETEC